MDKITAERFFELAEAGKTADEIGRALNKGTTTVQRYLMFYRFHGAQEFEKFYVDKQFDAFTYLDLANIVESIISFNLAVDRAAVIYKVPMRKKLDEMTRQRRNCGHPLHDDAKVLPLPNNSWLASSKAKGKNKEHSKIEQKTFLTQTGRDKMVNIEVSALRDVGFITCTSKDADSHKSGQATDVVIEPLKERIGRATAPVKSGRGKKEKRSYAVVRDIKNKKKLKQLQQVLKEPSILSSQADTKVEQAKNSKRPKVLDADRPHLASEYFEESEKNVKSRNMKIYDPHSEGFAKLPKEVQLRSLLSLYTDATEELTILKKLEADANDQGLTASASNKAKCVQALEFIEECPNFKRKNILKALELPESVFGYYMRHNKGHDEDEKYAEVIELMKKLQLQNNFTLGRRRMTLELRKYNVFLSPATVSRLQKKFKLEPLHVTPKEKPYSSYIPTEDVPCNNEINRNFKADEPGKKFVTDVSEFNVNGEKLYLSIYVDLFNHEIVSYSIGLSPSVALCVEPLKQMINYASHENGIPVIHSDQGHQYFHKSFKEVLKQANIKQSMSRKANCYDNGVAECRFGTIKNEIFANHRYCSVEDLAINLIAYIDYYNEERIQVELGGLSPILYRKKYEENKKYTKEKK